MFWWTIYTLGGFLPNRTSIVRLYICGILPTDQSHLQVASLHSKISKFHLSLCNTSPTTPCYNQEFPANVLDFILIVLSFIYFNMSCLNCFSSLFICHLLYIVLAAFMFSIYIFAYGSVAVVLLRRDYLCFGTEILALDLLFRNSYQCVFQPTPIRRYLIS